jgi:transglutaminase-like putative cysteine protease
MPTDFAFRLSTYLSLGLACVCLGYGEWELLPEVSVFAALVIVTLVISFRTGSSVELTLPQANRLGLTIGLIAALWVGWHYVRPNSLMHTLPWPAGLLPYIGPLLMVLMPAKLLRPKHIGDWWALQAVGMVSVALAGAMADDGAFGTLLTLYAVCGVWGLGLFYFRRTAGNVPPVTGTPPIQLAGVVTPPHPRGYFVKAVGWAAVAAGVALPVFFLTPRNGTRWQMGKQMEVGYSADQHVDLNRTGELQVDREVVVEVDARYADGRPMDDLSGVQRWRGQSFGVYESGRWSPAGSVTLFLVGNVTPGDRLPDLGGRQYTLDYHPTPKLTRPVVAEPVAWSNGAAVPLISVSSRGTRGWSLKPDGTFAPLGSAFVRDARYRQACRAAADPDLGPGFVLAAQSGFGARAEEGMTTLRAMRLRRLREWAVEKLREFARTGRVAPEVLVRAKDRGTLQVDPADYEAVGRAFRDYLAGSGEFRYDLTLRRQDKGLDPIEDFLFNTKSGHCERFASALALALRGVGVPTAFVMGFKGCDADGDGRYVIRQEHAHAWVEILVPRPTPDGFRLPPRPTGEVDPPPPELWHWLTLDPTPDGGTETTNPSNLAGWFDTARENWVQFFHDFIIGYNADRHRDAVATVSRTAGEYRWHLAAAGGILIVYLFGQPGLRWWRRRQERLAGPRHTGLVWYDRYLDGLAAHGFPVPPGLTPREYAGAVADRFRSHPATVALADLPGTVAEAFYTVRYAGCPLDPSREAALLAAVNEFSAALRRVPVSRS